MWKRQDKQPVNGTSSDRVGSLSAHQSVRLELKDTDPLPWYVEARYRDHSSESRS